VCVVREYSLSFSSSSSQLVVGSAHLTSPMFLFVCVPSLLSLSPNTAYGRVRRWHRHVSAGKAVQCAADASNG
jgi:hypothetical protein